MKVKESKGNQQENEGSNKKVKESKGNQWENGGKSNESKGK